MNSGKFLSGIMAGLALGTIAGILFAPEKGSDTRKKIMKIGEDFANGIKEKVDEFSDSIKDTLDTAKNDVADTLEKGEEKLASARKGYA